jgi:hypothetical protein
MVMVRHLSIGVPDLAASGVGALRLEADHPLDRIGELPRAAAASAQA